MLVDLGDKVHHISIGHLSMFQYPWPTLLNCASNGNLFVCHLVREARPIFDPDDYLPRLREAFVFRNDYSMEIEHAMDLGWYLVRFGDQINSRLLTKRVLWCVRTVLIARGAEQCDPAFSHRHLAERTQSAAGRDLLIRRQHETRDALEVRNRLRLFFEEEEILTAFNVQASESEFIRRFNATSNKVALGTLEQEEVSQAYYSSALL